MLLRNHPSDLLSIRLYINCLLLIFLTESCVSEKVVSQAYNQSHYNHRTGPATNIPWSVLFDPNFSGVVKVDGNQLTSTTQSPISVFYGQNSYSPSSYGQSSNSKKKLNYSYKTSTSTAKSLISTSTPSSGPVVVAYSSPDQHAESSNSYLTPSIGHRPIYSEVGQPSVYPEEKEAEIINSKAESRIQAPAYNEKSYSRPYYPDYTDEEDKRPVYKETPIFKKNNKQFNDRRPPEYYKKFNKPNFSESQVGISDDPFEQLSDPFDEAFATKITPVPYSKKKKGHHRKPDEYFSHFNSDKEDEFSSETKHHPFYNYDYYGDYYEGSGPSISFKHRIHPKRKSKYGPLAFALGLLPLGLMLAAIVPSVMTLPTATVSTTAGRKKRNVLEEEYKNPVLDVIAKYGIENLDDPLCMQRIFCQVTTEGSDNGSNFLLKVFYKLAKLLDENWVDKFGLKLLLRAIKRDQCEAFPCPFKQENKMKT